MKTTFNVIGVAIDKLTMHGAITALNVAVRSGTGGYGCFVNAHVTVTARKDLLLKKALKESTFAFPDGMPVYLTGRLRGESPLEKVSGPDFMQEVFTSKQCEHLRHYFYGGKEEVLEGLVSNIKIQYKNVQIVGYESPPFRPLSERELEAARERIRVANPDLIWIGLGAPKQEIWMNSNWQSLRPAILLGVGAAFDFHSGHVQRAPEIWQKFGLEWLHRLLQEPGRLWKRYLITNSLFIGYSLLDLIFKR